jgi:signal transduction histidine kinase
LSNAIKYRSINRPLKIKIKTYKENNFLILSITDNGLGINYNQQSKLFTMFKRLHSHVEGTGIGLYIIKRIVENNQGKIEVQSEEGKGTTFKVYLQPLAKKMEKVRI